MMSRDFLNVLGIEKVNAGTSCAGRGTSPPGEELESIDPSTGTVIARVIEAEIEDYEKVIETAVNSFRTWRLVPAPKRGEIIRQIGEELRRNKRHLAQLITHEMGKIISESEGEVQEMIDICDFAAGMSRQLYGVTTNSERPEHRMYEQWHPLGVTGVITAFNFPMAVWAWNAAIAAVCGNTVVWKPSRETPLCSIAVHKICDKVTRKNNLTGIFNLIIGKDSVVGERLTGDYRVPLISATGSVKMGRHVGQKVMERFGRSILELGGNAAAIVLNDADINIATDAVLFSAVGTTGQRCTTLRRLIIQKGVIEKLIPSLNKAYGRIRIGDPSNPMTQMGPLINQNAVNNMMSALKEAVEQGGSIIYGGNKVDGLGLFTDYNGKEVNRLSGFFVEPTLVMAHKDMAILKEETFAPILYVIEVENLDEAIEIQNNVPQGLSSAIFTNSIRNSEKFLSCEGSDCGIANVNIGTSGAEIGLAFGGEKETGGGREAGSDAWKSYMRRQSCTINWSSELHLAQGVKFKA